jgi:hypothetical protein
MADSLDDVECIAIVLADQLGREAARLVRNRAESTAVIPEYRSLALPRNRGRYPTRAMACRRRCRAQPRAGQLLP